MPDEPERRSELARFLRSRRQLAIPHQAGFAASGRRRTPGLRREEVAVLAGVSTTWYTYLEQGRSKNVSPAVLDSIARVLRLSEDERRYIHFLAYGQVIDPQPLEDDPPVADLLARVVTTANHHPYPVYMTDHRSDLIAWNRSATEWYDDWARLPTGQRNLIHWLFMAPRAKESLVNWESLTRDMVARWRTEIARWPGDPQIQRRVEELLGASREFARCWDDHEVADHRSNIRHLRHPRLGVHSLRTVPVCSLYSTVPGILYHFPA